MDFTSQKVGTLFWAHTVKTKKHFSQTAKVLFVKNVKFTCPTYFTFMIHTTVKESGLTSLSMYLHLKLSSK